MVGAASAEAGALKRPAATSSLQFAQHALEIKFEFAPMRCNC